MALTCVVVSIPINLSNTINYIQEALINQELMQKHNSGLIDYQIDEKTIQIITTSAGAYAVMLAFKKK